MGPRRPLRLKLTAVALVLTALPLLAVGWRVYDVNERALAERAREFQLAIAGDIGRAVAAQQDRATASLAAVRRLLVEDDVGGPDGLADDARVTLATVLVGADPLLDHVAIYDADGRLIDALLEDGLRVEPPPRLAADLRVARGSTVGPAEVNDVAPDNVRVPVALAIEVAGRATGHLVSAVSLAPVRARLRRLARTFFAGQPDPIYVVDLQRRRILGAGPPGATVDSPALDDLTAESHRAGFAPSRAYVSADGQRRVAARVPIAGTPWSVVVQQPAAIVFAGLVETRRAVALSVVVALLLAWLAGWLVARRLTAPLRALMAYVDRLAVRDFDAPLALRTADELETLAGALSSAAGRLAESEAALAAEAAIRGDLGRYLPAELVDRVVERKQDMALGGRRMPITVMFADIAGFTPLSERLPPETVVGLLNELFTLSTEIVFRHGGVVDKFIGDCLMAVWGAPDPQVDHAARALAAAEEMMQWIEVAARGWQTRHGVELALAIGINSGEAVVGNIGSDRRMQYTAIGDAVNVAARLEALARPSQILVTEATREAAGAAFDCAFVERRTVSGRAEPVALYEVRH